MPKKDSQTRPGGMVSPERRNVTRSAAEATATRSQTKVRAGSSRAPIPLKKKLLPHRIARTKRRIHSVPPMTGT